MTVTALPSPFGAEPLEEVPLPRAPLERVLAQVRFPKEPMLATEEGAGALRERLKHRYPILRDEQQVEITVAADGVTQRTGASPLWRLQDVKKTWQVSFTDTFVAVDTSAYVSRNDFCVRLGEVLTALREVAPPVVYDRFGVRYIDRLTDEALVSRLPSLVRPEVLGAISVPLPDRVELVHALTEAVFRLEGGQLVARWGTLPAGATVEPTVRPVPVRSWLLDIDAATTDVGEFDPDTLTTLAEHYAERVYRFFRWAVTDEFLRAHGGQL